MTATRQRPPEASCGGERPLAVCKLRFNPQHLFPRCDEAWRESGEARNMNIWVIGG